MDDWLKNGTNYRNFTKQFYEKIVILSAYKMYISSQKMLHVFCFRQTKYSF